MDWDLRRIKLSCLASDVQWIGQHSLGKIAGFKCGFLEGGFDLFVLRQS
jgi:hypothetical protein